MTTKKNESETPKLYYKKAIRALHDSEFEKVPELLEKVSAKEHLDFIIKLTKLRMQKGMDANGILGDFNY